jgi:crotonobetainyl-CoA:carnitine CoA-transferase CaiB-like acyl-CoA transferase
VSPLNPGPLGDVRILDLAGESGVLAGRLLADLGADVIQIEPPGGSAVRRRSPFLEDLEGVERSLYHHHFNANKRGVTLDITRPEGLELLRRLVAASDAVIETAPPGEMDALGAGFEALRQANPSLLYVTITPFGQQGPMRDYRGNDLICVAASGLMYLNGDPEDPPNQPGAEQAYQMASLVAASGLLTALYGRNHRAGHEGNRIDVSLQEAASMSTLQTANANAYAWFQRVPRRRGLTVFGGRDLFQCRDGRWVSFVIMPYRWDDFVRWLRDEGIESEVRGEAWRDQAYRARNPGAASAAIAELASRHNRDEVFHEGQKRLISVMPVNDVGDLVEDPQLLSRDFFVPLEAGGRSFLDAGPVPRMTATPLGLWRQAPRLGEHNGEVYGGLLGIDERRIDELREAGVI